MTRRASARAASGLTFRVAKARIPRFPRPLPGGCAGKLTLASAVAAVGAILLGSLWLGNRWGKQPVAHYNRGVKLHRQGMLEEAVAEYGAAIRLKPDDAEAHKSLAWALVVSPKRPRQDYDGGLVHAARPSNWRRRTGTFPIRWR